MELLKGARVAIVATYKYSRGVVIFSYKTCKGLALPLFVYINVSDLQSSIVSYYRTGVSPQTKQKAFFVFLNLTSSLAVLIGGEESGKDIMFNRVNPIAFAPTAAGLILRTFSRAESRKVKLAVVSKENSLIKKVIIENMGQFNPRKILNENLTVLTSGDELDNACAEQRVLLETLRKMKEWKEYFEKGSTHVEQLTNHQEYNNEQIPIV